MSDRIYLNTPTGRIAIVTKKITAVVEADIEGANGTKIMSQVYVDCDEHPFNVLEDFDYVSGRI